MIARTENTTSSTTVRLEDDATPGLVVTIEGGTITVDCDAGPSRLLISPVLLSPLRTLLDAASTDPALGGN